MLTAQFDLRQRLVDCQYFCDRFGAIVAEFIPCKYQDESQTDCAGVAQQTRQIDARQSVVQLERRANRFDASDRNITNYGIARLVMQQ